MLSLIRPSDAAIEAVRAAASADALSYDASVGGPPPGYRVDADEAEVGRGQAAWERTVAAIHAWRMFDLPWIHRLPAPAPAVGLDWVFASRQLGTWMVHTCRVTEVVDVRDDAAWLGGFAYGTLATHAVSGEERFEARWDRATDRVTFAIRKFYRPNHWTVRLAGPIGRRLQARFSQQAIAHVAAVVRSGEAA